MICRQLLYVGNDVVSWMKRFNKGCCLVLLHLLINLKAKRWIQFKLGQVHPRKMLFLTTIPIPILVKALNEIKASLGWRVVYAWIGDDPCGDGDLPPWSGVTCSTQGDYRVVTELNRYQFDQVTEDAMVDRLAVSPLTITTLKR
ncbi:uncharacterized protein [Gossypium hirsutum]|uniref:Uncharacterized protein isoform X3 n=1 Tax=Gossypium hirsutum TaxID=3635 RepID=A0ABM3BBG5_GOSHI|nr:uncharacterized protein LOC107945833 isoform X3 [Gossypium hirsutum]